MDNNSKISTVLGKLVALKSSKGYLQLGNDGVLKLYNFTNLKFWRTWERFLIISVDNNEVLLFSPLHNLYSSINGKAVSCINSEEVKFRIIPHDDKFSFITPSGSKTLMVEGEDQFEIIPHPYYESKDDSSQIPKKLIDDIKNGKVIAFIGAGFTVPAGFPSWAGLLKKIVDKNSNLQESLKIDINVLIDKETAECLDQAAQILEDELGSSQFSKTVADILKPNDPLPDIMKHRLDILQQIPFKSILTTNVDLVVPNSVSNFDENEAPKLRTKILRSPPKGFFQHININDSDTTPVLQLHGSIRKPEEMVFTRKGYRKLLHGNDSYLHFIRSVMSQYTILYLGFSFSDYYLNDIRSSVLQMLLGDSDHQSSFDPLAYAITNDKGETDISFFFKHEGTHFINYNGDHNQFDELLTEIKNKTSPMKLFCQSLSNKKIIWNDSWQESIPHWKYLAKFMTDNVQKTTGNNLIIEFVESAEEVMHRLENNTGDSYDLIITQYNAKKGESHKILREIKRLQLKAMDYDQNKSDHYFESMAEKYSNFPAVIVFGMNYFFESRKNQLTRLGALDYCGYGYEGFTSGNVGLNQETICKYDLQLFSSIYNALSRNEI